MQHRLQTYQTTANTAVSSMEERASLARSHSKLAREEHHIVSS